MSFDENEYAPLLPHVRIELDKLPEVTLSICQVLRIAMPIVTTQVVVA